MNHETAELDDLGATAACDTGAVSQSDIPIGDDAVIEWIPLDGCLDSAVSVDDPLPVADWFWPALEGHCISECCGIDAFDVSPEGIRWAAGADISPPAWLSGRPDERCDPLLLTQRLDETIAKVQERGAGVVSSSIVFNQLFDTSVFVELIAHIADVLRQASGHEIVTTTP